MLLIIWSNDTFSIFDSSGRAFDYHILDGGSPLLISGLSSNFFRSRKKIAPVWHNKINGETHGQIEGLSHIFFSSGLIFLSETFLALLFRIPYSWASIQSLVWEVLQEVSIRLDDVDFLVTLKNLLQH